MHAGLQVAFAVQQKRKTFPYKQPTAHLEILQAVQKVAAVSSGSQSIQLVRHLPDCCGSDLCLQVCVELELAP